MLLQLAPSDVDGAVSSPIEAVCVNQHAQCVRQFIAAVATLPVGVQRAGRLEQQEQRVISTLPTHLSGRS
jgi:hypothetical protein